MTAGTSREAAQSDATRECQAAIPLLQLIQQLLRYSLELCLDVLPNVAVQRRGIMGSLFVVIKSVLYKLWKQQVCYIFG